MTPLPPSPPRRDRRRLISAVALAALLAATVIASLRLSAAAGAAERAAADLAASRKIAARITELRRRPALAGDEAIAHAELTGRIEAAARRAQVPPERLVRIDPGPERRLGESAYKEKPTQVALRGVSLRQLIGFLHALTAAGPEGGGGAGAGGATGLRATALRISAPREGESAEGWAAEATLSYLLYAPAGTGGATRNGG